MSGQVSTRAICRRAGRWLAWVCLMLFVFYGLWGAYRIGSIYPTLSVRYDTPIGANTADGARRYAAANSETVGFWPTYWAQSDEQFSASFAGVSANCLWYSGDGGLVWPVQFLAGGYPAELDDAGLCLSSALAWQLWGDCNVVGLTVTVQKAQYTVRGVFSDKMPLALISCGNKTPKSGWQAAELAGQYTGDGHAAAEQFALSSGLGKPDTILNAPAIGTSALCLALLPLVPLAGVFTARLVRWAVKRSGTKKGLLLFALALAFAAGLPVLLALLPQRFIPNRWSDFAFWGRLAEMELARLRGWLALRPLLIDVEASMILLKQGAAAFGGTVMAVLVCCSPGKPRPENK